MPALLLLDAFTATAHFSTRRLPDRSKLQLQFQPSAPYHHHLEAMAVSSNVATFIRIGARGAQFVLSLFALAFTAAGYVHYDSYGYSAQLSSPSAIFAILMTYSAMMYALWAGVAVELVHYAQRPTALVELVIDGALALMLLIAGIAQAASKLVSDCSDVGTGTLRCGNLKAGAAFAFLAVVAFLVTIALQFVAGANNSGNNAAAEVEAQHQQYEAEQIGEAEYHKSVTTPVAVSAPLSPIGQSQQ